MKTQKADELIKHLHQYKLTIADLYEAFAFIFPASSKIWTLFASKERLHARYIKALHAQGKKKRYLHGLRLHHRPLNWPLTT